MIQLDFPFVVGSLETRMNTRVAPPVPKTSHVSPWLTQIVYPLGSYIVLPFFFGKIEVIGQENLPTTGPVVLAPTHRSRWDALLVPYATGRTATGRDLRFMVSADEVTGLQGWFIRRLGGFPVDTKHPAVATLRHGVELLQAGEMLVIFPEGNIFRDGQVHPLKPGLARMALSAETSHPGLGTKIVPIHLCYSEPYPQWGTEVTIRIGTPLHVAEYNTGSVKQNAKQLTAALAASLQNLSEQPHSAAAQNTEAKTENVF